MLNGAFISCLGSGIRGSGKGPGIAGALELGGFLQGMGGKAAGKSERLKPRYWGRLEFEIWSGALEDVS